MGDAAGPADRRAGRRADALRDPGAPGHRWPLPTQVAVWSSVIFGLVRLVNAIGTGAGAIGQAVAVSFAGYFFYLARRVSGGLLVPILAHALFDFSLLSGSITRHQYAAGGVAILAYLAAGGLLLARRHRIEIPAASRATTASA
jgi:hypothetical protein